MWMLETVLTFFKKTRCYSNVKFNKLAAVLSIFLKFRFVLWFFFGDLDGPGLTILLRTVFMKGRGSVKMDLASESPSAKKKNRLWKTEDSRSIPPVVKIAATHTRYWPIQSFLQWQKIAESCGFFTQPDSKPDSQLNAQCLLFLNNSVPFHWDVSGIRIGQYKKAMPIQHFHLGTQYTIPPLPKQNILLFIIFLTYDVVKITVHFWSNVILCRPILPKKSKHCSKNGDGEQTRSKRHIPLIPVPMVRLSVYFQFPWAMFCTDGSLTGSVC